MSRFRPPVLLSLLLLFSSTAAADGGLQWTKGGPSNSGVSRIFVDPQAPQNLYALADNTVCKSTDGGRHWNLLASEFALAQVSALAVDPTRPARILIGTDAGVFLSTDGGTSWKPDSLNLTFVNSIWIDPSKPDTVYARSSSTIPSGFYRTLDGGSNWSRLILQILTVDDAAFAVGPDGTVFIGSFSGGIFLSRDRGESWIPAGQSPPPFSQLRSLVVDPTTPTTVYASTSSGLFRSADSGGSWELRGGGSPSSLAIDPTNSAVLYAGAPGGVWKTVDTGRTWQPLGVGPPFASSSGSSSVVALAIDPQNPTTVYSGAFRYSGTFSQGLFRSDDGGATWVRSDKGLPGLAVRALAVDPSSPAVVYAGTASGQFGLPGRGEAVVYQSRNAGADWKETGAADLDDITALAVDPVTPTTLYVGTYCSAIGPIIAKYCKAPPLSGELSKSIDGGASWSTVLSSRISSLAIDPHSPETLYVGIGCLNNMGCRNVKSTDGGITWVDLEGLPAGFPEAARFLLDPFGVLYVVSSTGPSSSRVFKSTNGGASWSAADVDLPLYGLAIDASSPERLYATTPIGLFKSTDGANTWSATGLSLPVLDLAIDPRDPDVLYAATSGSGVLRSLDGGSTWQAINSGLASLLVYKIVIDSAGTYLHAATTAGGVYDLQLPRLISKAPSRPTHVVTPRTH